MDFCINEANQEAWPPLWVENYFIDSGILYAIDDRRPFISDKLYIVLQKISNDCLAPERIHVVK
jgi:hypothetical protein